MDHLYRNELDNACFGHDVACSDSKDLANRTISDKILKERAHDGCDDMIDGYQIALASSK